MCYNVNMENIEQVISSNLTFYRKNAGYTQIELAKKINYSDKAVSKWERGESLPDVKILTKLAEIYGITLNDFLQEQKSKRSVVGNLKNTLKSKKLFITLCSCCLVWIIATIFFVTFELTGTLEGQSWKCFIFAIPLCSIVAFIFSAINKNLVASAITLSFCLWGIFLSLFLSLNFSNIWLVFFVAIPIQILIIFSAILVGLVKKIKKQNCEN